MQGNDFYLKVAHALSACQLVELELKLYIAEALRIAKDSVGTKFPFKLSGEDYEDSSLEKLIGVFKKRSDNAALVARLNKFKTERNFLSHKGITSCLDYEGELFYSRAEDYYQRLGKIQDESAELCKLVHSEYQGLLIYLFEENPLP